MNISVTGSKIYYTIPIFGGLQIDETLVNTWIVMAVIVGVCIFLTRNLKVHPTSKRQIVAEYLVTTVQNFVETNMGKQFSYFTPFIGALITMSAFCSLISLFGLYAPTADLNTPAAWAVVVFVLIVVYKVKANGVVGYLRSYTQPIAVVTPFNIISEIVTPISMALRHFGNIAAGNVISTLIYAALMTASHMVIGLIPGAIGSVFEHLPIFAVGLPALLSIYFDVFASCLQAFIFCMLTMIYVSTGAEVDEEYAAKRAAKKAAKMQKQKAQ